MTSPTAAASHWHNANLVVESEPHRAAEALQAAGARFDFAVVDTPFRRLRRIRDHVSGEIVEAPDEATRSRWVRRQLELCTGLVRPGGRVVMFGDTATVGPKERLLRDATGAVAPEVFEWENHYTHRLRRHAEVHYGLVAVVGSGRPRRPGPVQRAQLDFARRRPPRRWRLTTAGMHDLRLVVGGHSFGAALPLALLCAVLERWASADARVLDLYAGSGVTGHAVLALNARDGGRRSFVLGDVAPVASALTANRVGRAASGRWAARPVAPLGEPVQVLDLETLASISNGGSEAHA